MNSTKSKLQAVSRRLRTDELCLDTYVEQVRETFEQSDPTVRAFVSETGRWDRLERSKEHIQARYPDFSSRRPLYGIPVGIKDIFHIDGFETKAGSSLPANALSGPEAPVVSRLREAGVLILGKTVTTEFAGFEPGKTRNPHDTSHTPGGSSSGSAAAVAADICPLALGSQTVGSITRPAAFCGVVGVKPTYGRVPTAGVVPVAPSVDHVGFFTKSMDGAGLAAAVLYDDWRAEDTPTPLSRIGIVEGPYLDQTSELARSAFASQVSQLNAAGFETERLDPLPNIDEINDHHNRLVAAETAVSHDELYQKWGERYAHKTREVILEGHSVSVAELAAARANRSTVRDSIRQAMDNHDVDIVVSPSAVGPAPRGLESTGDPIMNLPWTHAGVPTVSVPSGTTNDGLPLGLQCASRAGTDEWLLSWAQEIQRVFRD